jgi:Transposase DDE domain
MDAEVLLAAGYAALLVAIAFGLEKAARHVHGRSQQWRVAGFRYRREHDFWECPIGEKLTRVTVDDGQGPARYRASARACNACALKSLCTDSLHGREVEYHPDAWLQSELARFHRGLSLTLLLLAAAWLVAEMCRHQKPAEWLLLGGLLAPLTLLGTQLVSAFFAPPERSRNFTAEGPEWR